MLLQFYWSTFDRYSSSPVLRRWLYYVGTGRQLRDVLFDIFMPPRNSDQWNCEDLPTNFNYLSYLFVLKGSTKQRMRHLHLLRCEIDNLSRLAFSREKLFLCLRMLICFLALRGKERKRVLSRATRVEREGKFARFSILFEALKFRYPLKPRKFIHIDLARAVYWRCNEFHTR